MGDTIPDAALELLAGMLLDTVTSTGTQVEEVGPNRATRGNDVDTKRIAE